MAIEHNSDYLHHTKPGFSATVREIVFGMEDGMVSTMGAITGIATGTGDQFTVVLAGFVVIAVESIAMAVGSYLSSKSEREIDQRKLFEEKQEIKQFPKEEREELIEMYIEDGWSKDLAVKMADEAHGKPDIMLKEMAYRELKIIPDNLEEPSTNALYMFFSYIIGGSIPLLPYLFLPVFTAMAVSISLTLIGLFALGAATTKFSKRPWWKAGLEMLGLASAAAAIGVGVGQAVDHLYTR